MAKAKKLPSGQWRTLVYSHTDSEGKRKYESFTADSKKESEFLAAEFSVNKKNKANNTSTNVILKSAMESYCEIKSNVLSPSTLRGYSQLSRTAYSSIQNIKLKDLNTDIVQIWINEFSINHSPKTVRNAHGFLTAVLKHYAPKINLITTIPSKIRFDAYVPRDKEVQTLIEYYKINDNDMLIASCLAGFGTLRRSEICGLTSNNITGNVIQVRQSCVKNKDNKFEIKKFPKNFSSARDIVMPQFVIDMLPTDGNIVSLNPNQITLRHIKALKKLGINKFRFHDLRHYAASVMHAIGIPDQYIMQRGGWSSDKTLKDIYRGTMDDFTEKFNNLALDHYEKMQHDMQHKK